MGQIEPGLDRLIEICQEVKRFFVHGYILFKQQNKKIQKIAIIYHMKYRMKMQGLDDTINW